MNRNFDMRLTTSISTLRFSTCHRKYCLSIYFHIVSLSSDSFKMSFHLDMKMFVPRNLKQTNKRSNEYCMNHKNIWKLNQIAQLKFWREFRKINHSFKKPIFNSKEHDSFLMYQLSSAVHLKLILWKNMHDLHKKSIHSNLL